ncbi:MAG: hypothetical protein JNL05_13040 [Flavobacteriales bacterium]|nr:hypothetical protein [Flavobacteriales bacterium]
MWSIETWIRLTMITVALVQLGYLTVIGVRKLRKQYLLRKYIYAHNVWERDALMVRQMHGDNVLKPWNAVNREDRPMVITVVRSPKGEGAMATTSSKPTWTHDYAKGSGLETLECLAHCLAQIEANGNLNVISTMEVLLQREHERIQQERAIKTLTDTTN